ncbi:hypothetical protein PRIPAC_97417 [Pristionchus pacificus]|uniref:Uncharacterized protein n=1 Tax=Pristionchus pacificus TaxID=54126 RepID=A0A2A6D2I1_PRIPA|nr:hypothetical protein PRIPAC_97417 [Pristionchus pacificus]|eukprot:PDM84517.1 hypothetical protein PRIPAC_33540 [Pristionchus pacificus]
MLLSNDVAGQRFLRSVYGTFLRIRLGYVDLGPHCESYAHWHIEQRKEKIVLRAFCYPTKYLRANPDGFVDLADEAFEWEEWMPVRNDENGTWSFLSYHGTWLRAQMDGDVVLTDSLETICKGETQFALGCW